MNKEKFKTNQPIVYRVLSNALKQNRLAHAYLFVGSKGSHKEDTALLFAQSMVCEHTDADGFACQECDKCQKMAKNEALDFLWISRENQISKDGKVPTKIKKEAIVSLQEDFSRTANSDKRIYVIEEYDLVSSGASNSLLKFIEEPQPGIYGILITEEKTNVLPTIQSRCQIINFKTESYTDKIEELSQKTSLENATMLVESEYSTKHIQEWLENVDDFETVKEAAKEYLDQCAYHASIYKMQKLFAAKSAFLTKEYVSLLLDWLLYYVKNDKTNLSLNQKNQVQMILVESKDILRSTVDLALFLDKIYNQLRKVVRK